MLQALFGRSRPATRPAARFTPRLEALDGRVLPGGLAGGAVPTSNGVTVSRQAGEEIPQTGSNHAATQAAVWGADRPGHPGQVDTFGGMTGGVL
jgi:hypothetical protein